MSETTEGAELAVPNAAIEALKTADQRIMADPTFTVRAIAAPVVAAELRALAVGACHMDRVVLLRRADELDGGT